MKGHIRQSGGSWYVVLPAGEKYDSGGPKYRWHRVDGDKAAAERERIRLLHEKHAGSYIEPAKLTVAAYLEMWLDAYARHLGKATFDRYTRIVHNHLIPELGTVPLPKLGPMQIQSAYSRMLANGNRRKAGGLSARPVGHHHHVLQQALKHAVGWRLLARNPADGAKAPRRAKKVIQVLTADRVEQLLAEMRGHIDYIAVLIAIMTGLREAEVAALAWADVDRGAQTLWVKDSKPPTGRRSIALPRLLVDALLAHRQVQLADARTVPGYRDRGRICADRDGTPRKPAYIGATYANARDRLGLPKEVIFHGLHHTHATILLKRRVPLKVVSERLGHASVTITADLYQHVLEDMQQQAAREIDDVFAPRPTE